MLQYISIRHFILISALDLELDSGLTVITGESGAGKSMIYNAIAFAMGEKVDTISSTPLAEGASVCLSFYLTDNHPVRALLADDGIEVDNELLIRRTVQGPKRSRIFINDCPVTQKRVREIEPLLIQWQRQHAHIKLFDPAVQMNIVDQHINPSIRQAHEQDLRRFNEAQKTHTQKKALVLSEANAHEISYFLKELERSPTETVEEIQELFESHKHLQNEKQISNGIDTLATQVNEQAHLANQFLQTLAKFDNLGIPEQKNLHELASSIDVQLEELGRTLNHAQNQHQQSCMSREDLENHISHINDLARKHRLFPEELPALRASLAQQLHNHHTAVSELESCQAQLQDAKQALIKSAQTLHDARCQEASALQEKISQELQHVGLAQNQFAIAITQQMQADGISRDSIEFLASMNPQLKPGPIKSTLSGGELSRLSLIVNLLCPFQSHTLLMDEVDTGISGCAATRVGKILRQVAQNNTLLCITHTAQVAVHGDKHLQVTKESNDQQSCVSITPVTENSRAMAIAHLISDKSSQDTALSHAQSLIAQAREPA